MSQDSNPRLQRVEYQLRVDGVPREQQNKLRSGIHTRGFLPHVKREGASYFVTFRLSDSLPKEVLLQLQRKKAEQAAAAKRKKLVNRAPKSDKPIARAATPSAKKSPAP